MIASTSAMPLEMYETDDGMRVLVNGRDVSGAIRTAEVTRNIRKLDRNPRVRDQLVKLQQQFGAKGPTVAEGRDIGTVVFPDARCKIYMDASIDVRARRRAAQLEQKGETVDIDQLREEIRQRDDSDMTRDVAPLRKADDAILVDTSDMTFEQVVKHVVALTRKARQ